MWWPGLHFPLDKQPFNYQQMTHLIGVFTVRTDAAHLLTWKLALVNLLVQSHQDSPQFGYIESIFINSPDSRRLHA